MQNKINMTKIICTIGPSCNDFETLKNMIDEGMSIMRLNFSHRGNNFKIFEDMCKNIRNIRSKGEIFFGLAMDTKGPEVRISNISPRGMDIDKGEIITFLYEEASCDTPFQPEKSFDDESNNENKLRNLCLNTNIEDFNINKNEESEAVIDKTAKIVKFNFNNIKNLYPGFEFSLDDGSLKIKVIEIDLLKNNFKGEALNSHKLLAHKSANFPGISLGIPFLSENDKEDLIFGLKNDIDFIFASFVSSKEDIIEMRQFLSTKTESIPFIVSKIESRDGVKNLDEIIKYSDGIMIARGDLGAEHNLEDLLVLQKIISERCRKKNIPYIIATQMIETMVNNSKPTRAEISDIGNAVIDGADCVMTSSETAIGKYPVKVVKIINNICFSTEKYLREKYLDENKNIVSFKDEEEPKPIESIKENDLLCNYSEKETLCNLGEFSSDLSDFNDETTSNSSQSTDDRQKTDSKILSNEKSILYSKKVDQNKDKNKYEDLSDSSSTQNNYNPAEKPHLSKYFCRAFNSLSNDVNVCSLVLITESLDDILSISELPKHSIPIFIASNQMKLLRKISIRRGLIPYKLALNTTHKSNDHVFFQQLINETAFALKRKYSFSKGSSIIFYSRRNEKSEILMKIRL